MSVEILISGKQLYTGNTTCLLGNMRNFLKSREDVVLSVEDIRVFSLNDWLSIIVIRLEKLGGFFVFIVIPVSVGMKKIKRKFKDIYRRIKNAKKTQEVCTKSTSNCFSTR